MNILIVSHEYPPIGGGGANACYYLSKEYAKSGHCVTIVTALYKDLPKEETINGVQVIRVRALRKEEEKSTFLEMLTYLASAWYKVSRMVKDKKFDVCQIFFGIPSGPIGWYLKKKYHIPYIIRFGGGDIPGAQKRFSIIYKMLTPAIRVIWANADALVANSEALRQKALLFESKYPIEIISNGVDSEYFSKNTEAKKESNTDKRIEILFVSRLIKGKGLQFIIPEMRRINQESEKKVNLVIVGDGPYREELEEITQKSDVSSFVRFEGKKNKKELYSYYKNSDFLILPSESEGMPNVVLEGMAMGLPVIMTPCGGSKELIQGNGYVASIDQFTERIIELCQDGQGRINMGRESEMLARTKFSWQEKAKEYIELFRKSRE